MYLRRTRTLAETRLYTLFSHTAHRHRSHAVVITTAASVTCRQHNHNGISRQQTASIAVDVNAGPPHEKSRINYVKNRSSIFNESNNLE